MGVRVGVVVAVGVGVWVDVTVAVGVDVGVDVWVDVALRNGGTGVKVMIALEGDGEANGDGVAVGAKPVVKGVVF